LVCNREPVFFLGKLGRGRVAAIYEPGVEIPSDYSGVLFIQYDSQAVWQFRAAQEIKAAIEIKAGGIKVDLNRKHLRSSFASQF
jgi:predicted nucleotide-binding protein